MRLRHPQQRCLQLSLIYDRKCNASRRELQCVQQVLASACSSTALARGQAMLAGSWVMDCGIGSDALIPFPARAATQLTLESTPLFSLLHWLFTGCAPLLAFPLNLHWISIGWIVSHAWFRFASPLLSGSVWYFPLSPMLRTYRLVPRRPTQEGWSSVRVRACLVLWLQIPQNVPRVMVIKFQSKLYSKQTTKINCKQNV